jgi:DNA repair exonuclease SbcCD ATPase subunit
MDLFKKLKDTIWEDEGPKEPKPPLKETPKSQQSPPSFVPIQSNLPSNPSLSSNPTVPIDVGSEKNKIQKYTDILSNALDTANIPGVDFYEFCNALSKLETIMPGVDEVTRYKSAYYPLEASGATVQTMIETADHYLQILENEKKNFIDHNQAKISEEVDQRNKELEQINASINAKQAEITRLTQELTELSKNQKDLQEGIVSTKLKLESDYSVFMVVFEQFISKLSNIKQKFITYLGVSSGTN